MNEPKNGGAPARDARGKSSHDLRTVPPQTDKAEVLHRTVPCRQRQAAAYLDGKSPGVMQSYAPDAKASAAEGWVESDDTVHRLAHWREEAIY